MKTTILIGYSQTDSSGNPVGHASIVSGPPANESEARAQAKLFSDAKQLHQFPKGVKFLAFCNVEQSDAAAHISDAVSEQVVARETNRLTRIAEQLEIAEANQKRSNAIVEAKKRISKAAIAHNNAAAALGTARRQLEDAEANLRATKTKSAEDAVAAAKKKVADLIQAEAAAKSELEEAKQAKAELLATKPPAAATLAAAEATSAPEPAESGKEKKGFFARLAGK